MKNLGLELEVYKKYSKFIGLIQSYWTAKTITDRSEHLVVNTSVHSSVHAKKAGARNLSKIHTEEPIGLGIFSYWTFMKTKKKSYLFATTADCKLIFSYFWKFRLFLFSKS